MYKFLKPVQFTSASFYSCRSVMFSYWANIKLYFPNKQSTPDSLFKYQNVTTDRNERIQILQHTLAKDACGSKDQQLLSHFINYVYRQSCCNNLMIQLQNYFNSRTTLPKNSILIQRRKSSVAGSRQIAKSLHHTKPRYRSVQNQTQQQQSINKSRRRYQYMMKTIRNPYHPQVQEKVHYSEKQRKKIVSFLKLNFQRAKLSDGTNYKQDVLVKSNSSEQRYDEKSAPKISLLSLEKKENCKFSTKKIELLNTIYRSKPKITILERILNAKHLKQVKQVVDLSIQQSKEVFQTQNQNNRQLKSSQQVLQCFKTYESQTKTFKRKSNNIVLRKSKKQKSFSKQSITAWRVTQLTE